MDKSHILVVDDEPINLANTVECLSDLYDLHFAKSGMEALEYLKTHHIDMLLLDVNMPEMDGFSVAQKIKDYQLTARIPIIYLTADTSENTIARAFDSGAADYITKPFKKKELRSRIKNKIDTERLKKRNEHLLEIIKANIAYIKTDLSGTITEASENIYKLYKCQSDENALCADKIIGMNISMLKSGTTHKSVYDQLWQALKHGKTFIHEIKNRNFEGGTNWFNVTITPDVDYDGNIDGYIAFYQNIDEKMKFKHDAHTDYLTQLHNRKIFEELLDKEILRSLRYNTVFSLILVDIDFFKSVNDTYGHDVGDIVLQEFAQILKHTVRESDIVARWGGEEFIILCPQTSLEGSALLAENIREKIATHTFSVVGNITASFGVVDYYKDHDATMLFKEVDNALYSSKIEGRNRVTLFNHKEK